MKPTKLLRIAGVPVAMVVLGLWLTTALNKKPNLPASILLTSGTLHGTVPVDFKVPLVAGETSRFSLFSKNTELGMTVLGSDGHLLTQQSHPLSNHVSLNVTIAAKTTADHTLRIHKIGGNQGSVSFELRVLKISNSGRYAREWQLASLLESEANLNYHQGTNSDALQRTEKFTEAISKYLAAASSWQKSGGSYHTSLNFYRAALIWQKLGKLQDAIAGYAKTIELAQDKNIVAWAHASMGSALNKLGEIDQAMTAFKNGLVALDAPGETDFNAQASLQNYLGLSLHNQNKLEEAGHWYKAAIESAQQSGNERQIAMTQGNLGGIHYQRDEASQALNAFKGLQSSSKAIGDIRGEVVALGNIGSIYLRTGEFDKALVAFSEVAKLTKDSSNREATARNLQRQGECYARLGDAQQARKLYKQALDILAGDPEEALSASIIASLAELELETGQWKSAIELYEQAHVLYTKLKRTQWQARTLQGAARAALLANRMDESITYIRKLTQLDVGDLMPRHHAMVQQFNGQMLAIRHLEKSTPNTSSNALGGFKVNGSSSHDNARNAQVVYERLEQAARGHKAVDNTLGEIETLELLSEFALDTGELLKSLNYAKTTIGLIESSRRQISVPNLRARFLAKQTKAYELAMEALIRMRADEPTAGHHIEALRYRDQAQARELKHLLAVGEKINFNNTHPEKLEKRDSLLRDYIALLTRLESQSEFVSESKFETENKVVRLKAQIDALDVELKQREVLTPEAVKIKELIQTFDTNKLVLVYWLGERQSFLWALTRNDVDVYDLPARKIVEPIARRLHRSLSASQINSSNEELANLGSLLFDPIETELANRNVAIVPDAILHLVPFAALRIPDKNHALVTAASVQILPSLGFAKVEQLSDPKPYKSLAVIADPVYSLTDERLLKTTQDSTNESISPVTRGGHNESRRLPHTGVEAASIATHFDAKQTLRLEGFAASKQAVLSSNFAKHDVVHWAVHAEAHHSYPELSSLRLSEYDEQGNQLDGQLSFSDIALLEIHPRLVVLSACQTAVGPLVRGEGVLSLSRVFLAHGARQVLATLWPVPDASSAELMKQFYSALLDQHLSPASALQQAQQVILNTPGWEDPYFWAGFAVVGHFGS